jgi:glycosyltransferase involved in cell wall biosynthesis
MAKVSVTIPTYNYARYLGEAITSILEQTYSDFELIVVDDGSTDNTWDIVQSFKDPRIRYIYQKHQGVSIAENTGLQASRSEYVAGLGADDIYLPDNLEIKVKYLDSHASVSMVCSDAYIFSGDEHNISGRFWRDDPSHQWVDPAKASQNPLQALIVHGCFIAPQATMIRRSVFDEVGGFDESLAICEDWDLLFRIACRFPIGFIDTPLLKLRRHDFNMSRLKESMYHGEATTLRKLLSISQLTKTEAKLAKDRLAKLHFDYGKNAITQNRKTEARKAMLDSLKASPRQFRAYAYLIASFLSSKGILTLKSWGKLARSTLGKTERGNY